VAREVIIDLNEHDQFVLYPDQFRAVLARVSPDTHWDPVTGLLTLRSVVDGLITDAIRELNDK